MTTAQELVTSNFDVKDTSLQRWQEELISEWLQILDVNSHLHGFEVPIHEDFPNWRQPLSSRHLTMTTAQELTNSNFDAKDTLLQRWQEELTSEWLQIGHMNLASHGFEHLIHENCPNWRQRLK
ncbi:hypothetical protein QE152_g38868 [Popillia japonica]|uniref:Uncharacterized protein n=1 Tax=Popillia japonica TaxID=7064 RepID=A0AAW1HV86_POPJA